MSLHESKSPDTAMSVDVATNIEGVIGGMEWDADEHKSPAPSSSSLSTGGEYQLSAQLAGHDYGVRDVASSGADTIATLEEKGRASIFVRSGASSWQRQELSEAAIHQSLAFVLANVEGCRMKGESRGASADSQHRFYPKGTFMSGGGDKAARPFTANGTFFGALTEHGGPVNSITHTHPERLIVTGAWDGVVRVWHGDEMLRKFDKLGHEHGTEVLGLESGPIVTASTNKHIIIIDDQGRVLKKITNAHDAPIRKLIAHPLGFASAANDGRVKVWSVEGDLLQTIDAATASEVKFLYGLAFIAGGNVLSASVDLDASRLVTCGEDGYVRIFDMSGRCVQELIHPGPVRSAHAIGHEGDFATACTDKKVRVFTRAAERRATEKERTEFAELGALVKASGMKALDTSTLETEEALKTPGQKNGQVKVLNITGRPTPIAYQWSDDLAEWVEIGEAMGASGSNGPQRGRSKLDGVEYDFVSDIWLTDTQKVQLGFNADDDPAEVTDRFCGLYQVPADMRSQIYEFVAPKCDMAAVAARRAREKSAAANAIVLRQVPSWTTGGFEMYSQANLPAMEKKILETNQLLAQQSHPFAIVGDELKSLRVLLENIRTVSLYHSASFTASEHAIVVKLLQWPTEQILAVMDAVRVLMMHGAANQTLGDDERVHTHLLQHAKAGRDSGKDTHQILLFKILSNWVAKRQRSPAERYDPPSAPKAVVDHLARAIEGLSSAAASQTENVALAFVMLLHNVICWFGRLKIAESELYPLVTAGVCELLNHKRNSKIQFYSLLTLGSIAYASTAARDLLRPIFSPSFIAFIGESTRSDNAALAQVAQDCRVLYQLK